MKSLFVALVLNELFDCIFLHAVKEFQLLLFNITNSIFQVFL